jgi:hypothetical protein
LLMLKTRQTNKNVFFLLFDYLFIENRDGSNPRRWASRRGKKKVLGPLARFFFFPSLPLAQRLGSFFFPRVGSLVGAVIFFSLGSAREPLNRLKLFFSLHVN